MKNLKNIIQIVVKIKIVTTTINTMTHDTSKLPLFSKQSIGKYTTNVRTQKKKKKEIRMKKKKK